MNLKNMFLKRNDITPEKMAELLRTTPDVMREFEERYEESVLKEEKDYPRNGKQMAELMRSESASDTEDMKTRIVEELHGMAKGIEFDRNGNEQAWIGLPPEEGLVPVTDDEILALPADARPELTGSLYKRDTSGEPSYKSLLRTYQMWKNETDPKKKKQLYGHFRQGLDILDLDEIVYEMLRLNPNAMGHWLPKLAEAVRKQEFFLIPETKILEVPLPMLQLTRLQYETHTRTTLDIVDMACSKWFSLDESKAYFVKTGTFSSKFDFRNAVVRGAQEVRELGEYLLFIQYQANCMAHYDLDQKRKAPIIYGVSTTNEWVVREYIEDAENNPTIYHGMPLHTEYRVFVDLDSDEVLGISPYWRPDVMKDSLGKRAEAGDLDAKHDYLIYLAHEPILMARYEKNKDMVVERIADMLPDIHLSGQWSIDVMQNGDDFYLIDMALAEDSALNDVIPKDKIRKSEENWIPDFHVKSGIRNLWLKNTENKFCYKTYSQNLVERKCWPL